MTPFMFGEANKLVRSIMRGSGGGGQWQRRMARRLCWHCTIHSASAPASFCLNHLPLPLLTSCILLCHQPSTQEGNPELYTLLRQREAEARARLTATGYASVAPPPPAAVAAAAARRRLGDAEAARLEAEAGEAAAGPSHGCVRLPHMALCSSCGTLRSFTRRRTTALTILYPRRWEVDEDEMEACWLDPGRALRQEAEAAAAASGGGAAGGGQQAIAPVRKGGGKQPPMGPGPLPGGRM